MMKTCDDFYIVEDFDGIETTNFYLKERYWFWFIPVWIYVKEYHFGYDGGHHITWCGKSLDEVKKKIDSRIEWYRLIDLQKKNRKKKKYSSCKLYE